ncbi:ribosome recycling factor [Thecamonas trahens ATCC 50062]|uniref:Ribosome recycling factor n=1 Tax=Thecamonas trahens ATCC 50062 TaxID=461836 RepID=A0A0L0D970_THETB|nr:ribosome recycling factor [Thecamonas trahens ATCC 50062]KNC48785.1 ribosome recycling factor [Thecamonas trahens ATCC 50062]|eukprot:XP_013762836.1 ribosome recycling factor [Thecamonas trahens ATCC 50062]
MFRVVRLGSVMRMVGEGRARSLVSCGWTARRGVDHDEAFVDEDGYGGDDGGQGDDDDDGFDADEYALGMEDAVEGLARRVTGLSSGRAAPELLDSVRVDAYGAPTPLAHIAQVATKGSNMLSVTLFDPSLTSETEKAIRAAGLNLNPVPAKGGLHVPVPKVTAELRRERLKQLAAWCEDARVAVRAARTDGMKHLKALEKTMPKEYWKLTVKEFEAVVNGYLEQIETVRSAKEGELGSD